MMRPVGVELFNTDGQMDTHDEANSLFRNSANAPKNILKSRSKPTHF